VGAGSGNPTAAYLGPFLAILAAGMISGAMSSGFEWLYSVRMIAAAVALWIYRRQYREVNWRLDWVALIAGVVIFLAWIAVQWMVNPNASGAMPAPLAAASTLARVSWIGLYIVSAVTTVPLAEELAFRGFLMRRLVSADFETVPFERFTWLAVIVSSVAFGAMHGSRWIAGSVSGVILALLAIRRGSLGDAVVAHATANALLAAYVLFFGKWQVW
jgi:CAAX prenyl protease-like protein